MLKKVSILIPYQTDHGPRDRLFHWVYRFYRHTMPEVEICTGTSDTKMFSRSLAINNAARKATRNVFAIADADVFFNPATLINAIKLLDQHAMVVPYEKVQYLSASDTERILKVKPGWPVAINEPTTQKPFETFGGLTVVKREDFEAIGGFDERFVGWGGEDVAFYISITTLCGPYKRLQNDVYHLFHPITGPKGNPKHRNNVLRAQKYFKAQGNKEAIQKLLHEQ